MFLFVPQGPESTQLAGEVTGQRAESFSCLSGQPGPLASDGAALRFFFFQSPQQHPGSPLLPPPALSPGGSRGRAGPSPQRRSGENLKREPVRAERGRTRRHPWKLWQNKKQDHKELCGRGGERAEQVFPQALGVSGRWSVHCLEPSPMGGRVRVPGRPGDSDPVCLGPQEPPPRQRLWGGRRAARRSRPQTFRGSPASLGSGGAWGLGSPSSG